MLEYSYAWDYRRFKLHVLYDDNFVMDLDVYHENTVIAMMKSNNVKLLWIWFPQLCYLEEAKMIGTRLQNQLGNDFIVVIGA